MNTTEQLVTEHLRTLADQAQPTPDLDAVREGATSPSPRAVRPSSTPGRQRGLLLPAAAAVLALVAGAGLVWMLNHQGSTGEVSSSPTEGTEMPGVIVSSETDVVATAFPVVDSPPDGLPVVAYAEQYPMTSVYTNALVGRRVDGRLRDAVVIMAESSEGGSPETEGRQPTPVTVMGQEASVFIRPTDARLPDQMMVTWGDGPYFAAVGLDPLPLLTALAPDAITASSATGSDDPPVIQIGELPDGFEVISPSRRRAESMSTGLRVGDGDFEVSVSSFDPLGQLAMAAAPSGERAELRSVDINGQTGWMIAGPGDPDRGLTNDVTWQVNDSTYAYVSVADGSSDERVLEFARSISFVDFNAWTELYGVTVTTEPTPATEPTVPTADLPAATAQHETTSATELASDG